MQNTPAQSRHYFQNSISKFGGSAARDDYFAPNYGQKSPELGGSAVGAYSGYSDEETELEREDFRCASRRPNETDRHKSRSEHAFHHYKDDSPEESSRYRIIQYQHKESRNSSRCESLSRHRESSHVYKSSCKTTNYHQRPSHMPHRNVGMILVTRDHLLTMTLNIIGRHTNLLVRVQQEKVV